MIVNAAECRLKMTGQANAERKSKKGKYLDEYVINN